MNQKRIRFLMTRLGPVGDDRRAKAVCIGLRDAGMEVIYTGMEQSPKQIIEAALQEDADVVGLSIPSNEEINIIEQIINLAKKYDLNNTTFILAGGIDTPKEDIQKIKSMGIKKTFGSDAKTEEIVEFLYEIFPDRPRY